MTNQWFLLFKQPAFGAPSRSLSCNLGFTCEPANAPGPSPFLEEGGFGGSFMQVPMPCQARLAGFPHNRNKNGTKPLNTPFSAECQFAWSFQNRASPPPPFRPFRTNKPAAHHQHHYHDHQHQHHDNGSDNQQQPPTNNIYVHVCVFLFISENLGMYTYVNMFTHTYISTRRVP